MAGFTEWQSVARRDLLTLPPWVLTVLLTVGVRLGPYESISVRSRAYACLPATAC